MLELVCGRAKKNEKVEIMIKIASKPVQLSMQFFYSEMRWEGGHFASTFIPKCRETIYSVQFLSHCSSLVLSASEWVSERLHNSNTVNFKIKTKPRPSLRPKD